MGRVFHIQRFSLYDGPGVRTVVFLKGCPLRCLWCHNPEGLERRQQIQFNAAKCIGCGDCASACAAGCHSLTDGLHQFDRAACTACGACGQVCCTGALTPVSRELTEDEVLTQVLRDRGAYGREGGMTLSGGEPLSQGEFACALLRKAKENGLHTCVETCGYADPQVLRQASEHTDLFLYDYKLTDPEKHRQYCGVSNEKILENLHLLDQLGAKVILRCPIIPGVNDEESHIQGIAAVAASHGCIREVQLEPYHRMGADKATQLGSTPAFLGEVPEQAAMENYCRTVAQICQKTVSIS